VGRAVSAALSPETDDAKAAHLAVKLIETADPRDQSTLTVTAEQSVEDMGLGQLMALAQANGVDLTRPSETPALEAQ
jgi:hypothetical protein